MSELAKRLTEIAVAPSKSPIDNWIASLDAADSAAWEAALLSGASVEKITELVKGEGVPVGRDKIRVLRRVARERAGLPS